MKYISLLLILFFAGCKVTIPQEKNDLPLRKVVTFYSDGFVFTRHSYINHIHYTRDEIIETKKCVQFWDTNHVYIKEPYIFYKTIEIK